MICVCPSISKQEKNSYRLVAKPINGCESHSKPLSVLNLLKWYNLIYDKLAVSPVIKVDDTQASSSVKLKKPFRSNGRTNGTEKELVDVIRKWLSAVLNY